MFSFVGVEEMGGNLAEIPDQAQPREGFESVVGDIDFPPEEALAGGGHEMVVIIVPAFTEGEEGQEPVVFAGVRRFVTDGAKEVGERIDGEGVVPEQNRAQAERPEEEREAANQIETGAQDCGRNEVIFVEPAELGKFGEVGDVVEARIVVAVGDDPANVGPEEAEKRRGMDVVVLIGEAMMMTMMGGPPEDAFLDGGHGQEGDDELEDAAGLIGAM